MNNLAMAYGAAGRTAEALALHEETLKLMKPKLGPDHPDTLPSMDNLAGAYRPPGGPPRPSRWTRRRSSSRSEAGPRPPRYPRSMNNLAVAYQAAGRTAEALAAATRRRSS